MFTIESLGTDDDDGTSVSLSPPRTIGGEMGSGLVKFKMPMGVCFAPVTNNILVCDFGNDRVQEVSEHGRLANLIPVSKPWSIALRGNLVAIATCCQARHIRLHNYTTGEHLRSLGVDENVRFSGLCFSPDGNVLATHDGGSGRVSVFTSDGAFVKHIGAGIVSNGSGVICLPSGDVVVADFYHQRVCVFSAGDGLLLRMWDSTGPGYGRTMHPCCLALDLRRLFVLDASSARITVFE